ncbi:hypothetical protein HPC38_09405 [Pasteurellaceae bacterium HPA106]|uniref:transferrin-binding protein-like solute binding protein n=1 Tax=Spirabiliibacterium pneumoniae TaxID=221400 RepID=UPI001AACB9D6|nr:transferrin-binding protein-like solute binding protein [Spirabiliibacterium pneumoniae]MBE2897085.1 hypothetical protein [Spirabiliibacterium pneumoniae]
MLEKKLIKLSLTALSALVLAACGSSGGDGDSSTDSVTNKVEDSAKKVENKAEETGQQAEDKAKETAKKTEEEAKRAEEKVREEAKKAEEEARKKADEAKLEKDRADAYAKNTMHGKGFTYNHDYRNTDVKDAQIDSNDLKFITIDGQKILEVAPEKSEPLIATTGDNKDKEIAGWRLASMSTFCCSDKQVSAAILGRAITPDNRVVAFYNGTPTDEKAMPTERDGVVKYYSSSASQFFVQGGFFNQDKTQFGDTSIVVDFGSKKVSGWTAAGIVEIDGKISGNGVNGTATVKKSSDLLSTVDWDLKTDADKTAPLNAQFYGDKAQSLAGEAHNQKWGVVFAAEKQK